ncbi:MAG TPA: hypothetical protein VGD29_26560 [Actinoplanes sp.]
MKKSDTVDASTVSSPGAVAAGSSTGFADVPELSEVHVDRSVRAPMPW